MQKYDILFKQPNNSSDIIKKEDETILFREKTTQKTEKGEKKSNKPNIPFGPHQLLSITLISDYNSKNINKTCFFVHITLTLHPKMKWIDLSSLQPQ